MSLVFRFRLLFSWTITLWLRLQSVPSLLYLSLCWPSPLFVLKQKPHRPHLNSTFDPVPSSCLASIWDWSFDFKNLNGQWGQGNVSFPSWTLRTCSFFILEFSNLSPHSGCGQVTLSSSPKCVSMWNFMSWRIKYGLEQIGQICWASPKPKRDVISLSSGCFRIMWCFKKLGFLKIIPHLGLGQGWFGFLLGNRNKKVLISDQESKCQTLSICHDI